MKLRIEIDENFDDEVIIRCKSLTDEIKLLQDVIGNAVDKDARLVFTLNDTEYYINRNDILFFETVENKTAAHTADKIFYTNYKLYELEEVLPKSFMRISKSSIINCKKVSAITKNITGASEVLFKDSPKKVYVSRMYFKLFKQRVEEML
ncbi:MAG: LytTR family transcriptional regulator [Clostridia bacterium]|nr:LytTR family transcriptional regulator [Clostridia bacterium]